MFSSSQLEFKADVPFYRPLKRVTSQIILDWRSFPRHFQKKNSVPEADLLGLQLLVEPVLVLLLGVTSVVEQLGDSLLSTGLGVLEDPLEGLQQLLHVGGGASERLFLRHSIGVGGGNSCFGEHFVGF